jgi:hypothetical protein
VVVMPKEGFARARKTIRIWVDERERYCRPYHFD